MTKIKAVTKSRTFDASEMYQMRQSEVEAEAFDSFSEARRENLERALQHAVKSVAGVR